MRRPVLEVVFDHALFENRRTGIDLYAAGPKRLEGALRENGHRLQANGIFRAAGRVDFTGGNHRGDATVQAAVDPSELVLARRPIAADGMYVAVDQSGSEACAFGIDRGGGASGVDVFLFADGMDHAVNGDDCVGIEDGVFEVSAEEESDVADHQFVGACRSCGGAVAHGIGFRGKSSTGKSYATLLSR